MKFRSIILTALAAVAVFASCQKPEEPLKTPSISLDPATLTVAEAGATETVALTATRAWKVDGTLPDWITITPDRGDGSNDAQPLTVTVAKNEGGNRALSIKFTIGLYDTNLKVEQAGPKGDAIETITVEEFLAKKDKNNEYTVKGIATGVTFKKADGTGYAGFDLVDETGTLPCAFPVNMEDYKSKLNGGDEVIIKGKYNTYQKDSNSPIKEQLYKGTILKVTDVEVGPAEQVTVAQFLEKKDVTKPYKLVGEVSKFDASHCSFDLTDETGTVVVWSVTNKGEWSSKIKDGGIVTLTGTYKWYEHDTDPSKSKAEVVDAVIEKFEMPERPEITGVSIADILAAANATPVTTKEVIVAAINEKGFVIAEGTDFIFAESDKVADVKIGDKVTVAGVKQMRDDFAAITEAVPTVISHDNALNLGQPVDLNSNFDAYDAAGKVAYVTYTGVLTFKDNKYYNVAVEGATKRTASLKYPSASFNLASFSGNKIKVVGFHTGFSGSGKYFNTVVAAAEPDGPYFSTNAPETLVFGGEAATKVINVNTNIQGWKAEVTGDAAFTAVVEGNTIKVSATENTTANRKATLTITAGEKVVTVVLLQAKIGDLNMSTIDLTKVVLSGSNEKSHFIVNEFDYDGFKLGSGSGNGEITIPASELKNGQLSFYAIGWNKKDGSMWKLTVLGGGTIDGAASKTIIVKENAGLKSGTPYTVTPADTDHFTFTLAGISASSSLKFENIEDPDKVYKDKRMGIWGIQIK